MNDEPDYIAGLNKQQKQAALHKEGPLLILAGAGAGKTKTLTHRILHLIHAGVAPTQILAITFTNKAAKEMRERVSNLIKGELSYRESEHAQVPFVSTFHALGVYILRRYSEALELPRHFTIYDRSDSISVVKKALKEIGEDPKQMEPRKILSIISRSKGDMVTHSEYAANTQNEYFPEVVAKVWAKYDTALKKDKALDFDDLLLKTALLLRDNEQIRNQLQAQWKYVHIDEYQDTNEVQYQIAKYITGESNNLCVVGDIDQNIYSWRGATIKNILGFEKDYPDAVIITLEQNYRSTGNILEAANSVIEKNVNRRKKHLFTENGSGDKISIYNAFDALDEARFVADTADNAIRNGVDPSEIAVLYRANFQSRVLEEKFLDRGIQYQVLGTRFFDRKEVKDVLAFIKASLNPNDLESTGRIINVPPRGIGKVTFLKVAEGNESELSGKAKESVNNFREILHDINQAVKDGKTSDVIKFVVKRTGMEEKYKNSKDDEDLERLENIKELATLATKYDGLEKPAGIEKLLEDAALATDQDELEKDNGGVKLMTIHASKGLEFAYVFITGLEEGLFPHERMGEKNADSEEERRLFYVALTRARQKVYLTYAGIRTIFGSQQVNIPSSFIGEIDEHLIEYDDDGGPDDVTSQAKSIFIDW